MDIKAHHSYLVFLIKGVWDEDPAARRLFESADLKGLIHYWADYYQDEMHELLRKRRTCQRRCWLAFEL
jgi:hypothetical protein